MRTKKRNDILSAPARILLAFIFLFGQTARATKGQNGKDKPDSKPAAKSQQAPTKPSTTAEEKAAPAVEATPTEGNSSSAENSQRGGPNEGIKVHGHWTIEVRNPDGTLVTHREFKNSLQQQSGAAFLASLLSGSVVSGPWDVELAGYPSPCLNSNSPADCQILQGRPSVNSGGSSIFFNLQTSAASGQFVLTGTAVAGEVGIISQVSTQAIGCDSSYTPTACFQLPAPYYNAFIFFFTAAKLAQPIPVSTGQTIAVTVTISFS